MLASVHRLTGAQQFASTIRRGGRRGSSTLVGHLLLEVPSSSDGLQPAAPRVGLVVSKAVGNAVVRNRVKRRLRHLVAAQLGTLPADAWLVLRALPSAGGASSAELGADLTRVLDRLLDRGGRRGASA